MYILQRHCGRFDSCRYIKKVAPYPQNMTFLCVYTQMQNRIQTLYTHFFFSAARKVHEAFPLSHSAMLFESTATYETLQGNSDADP